MSHTRRETSFLTLSSPAASCEEIKPFFTHSMSPAPLIVLNRTHWKQNIYHNINKWAKMQGGAAGRRQNFRNWISRFSTNRKLPLVKKPLVGSLSIDVFEPWTSTESRDFFSLMRISPFSFKKSSFKCWNESFVTHWLDIETC